MKKTLWLEIGAFAVLTLPSLSFAEGYGSGVINTANVADILNKATTPEGRGIFQKNGSDIDQKFEEVFKVLSTSNAKRVVTDRWNGVRKGFENIWNQKERIAQIKAARSQQAKDATDKLLAATTQFGSQSMALGAPVDLRDLKDVPEGCDEGGVKGALSQLETFGSNFKSAGDFLQQNLQSLLREKKEKDDAKNLQDLTKLLEIIEENADKEGNLKKEEKTALATAGSNEVSDQGLLDKKEKQLKSAQKKAAKALREFVFGLTKSDRDQNQLLQAQQQFATHTESLMNQVSGAYTTGSDNLRKNCNDLRDAAPELQGMIQELQTKRLAAAEGGNAEEIRREGDASGKVGEIVTLLGTNRRCQDVTGQFEARLGGARGILSQLRSSGKADPQVVLGAATQLFTTVSRELPFLTAEVNELARACTVFDTRIKKGKEVYKEMADTLSEAQSLAAGQNSGSSVAGRNSLATGFASTGGGTRYNNRNVGHTRTRSTR